MAFDALQIGPAGAAEGKNAGFHCYLQLHAGWDMHEAPHALVHAHSLCNLNCAWADAPASEAVAVGWIAVAGVKVEKHVGTMHHEFVP